MSTASQTSSAAYRQQLKQRLAGLKSKHRARERQKAYAGNIEHLTAEIAKLERVLAALDDPAIIAEDVK
tara:strand:- start:754 stop:960 length:207 start_codon:yes stop_codon:yes gene_type:complete